MTISRAAAVAVICLASALGAPAAAQFVGPSAAGTPVTVAAAAAARPGTYVIVEGSIRSHLREDYYLFADEEGEVRVEIEPSVFGGREVTPEMRLRLAGEVDRSGAGMIYIWVKSLDMAD